MCKGKYIKQKVSENEACSPGKFIKEGLKVRKKLRIERKTRYKAERAKKLEHDEYIHPEKRGTKRVQDA